MIHPLLLTLAWTAISPVYAQQYAGETITTSSLPKSTGSEITFFNIKDANGANTTLVNYYSLPTTTGKRPDPTKLQRLVISLAGSNRNAGDYFSYVWAGIASANKINSQVTEETVAIVAPWYANTDDLPKGSKSALVWNDIDWSGGSNNVFPSSQTTVSSFDCIDQILTYFDNKSIFPNIKHMVVAGHSRGAQMNHRYAAVGKPLGLKTPITYWIGNPNSYLWFNSSRPIAPKSCSIFNEWREGLDDYTNPYQNAFVQNASAVYQRYISKDIALARGLNDHGNVNDDCKPVSQGANRDERFLNYVASFAPDSSDTVDYEKIGHNPGQMMGSQSGVQRIFLDDWDGQGHRHADFGDRRLAGDNPHPTST